MKITTILLICLAIVISVILYRDKTISDRRDECKLDCGDLHDFLYIPNYNLENDACLCLSYQDGDEFVYTYKKVWKTSILNW